MCAAPFLLRLACRKSPLAIRQCELIQEALTQHYPRTALTTVVKTFSTQADQTLNTPLHQFSTTGVFVKELEQALLNNKADVAVHSFKDLPTHPPKGLAVKAIIKRISPHDVLVTPPHLAPTAAQSLVIGTSSLRRQLFLKKAFPTWTFQDLRGNIHTRLNRLLAGDYDGIVLAEASFLRLDLLQDRSFVSSRIPYRTMLPAPAQGALALQCRSQDRKIAALIKKIHHEPTATCVCLERRILKRLGGGCHTPLGVYVEETGGIIRLRAMIGNIETARIKRMTLFSPANDAPNINKIVAKIARTFQAFMPRHRY